MKRILTTYTLFWILKSATAQAPVYSSLNGHSHNDYAQKRPFVTAFKARMGSIEADVFLVNDTLFVAHDRKDIKPTRTLENLYLKPLATAIETGKNYPLQFLIDIKTEADSTLRAIVRDIAQYPSLYKQSCQINIVISGNRPKPIGWLNYPNYIQFDGRPTETYNPEQWQRIGLMSANYKQYESEVEKEIVNPIVFQKMKTMVEMAHTHGKKVRFWGTTDSKKEWKTLMALGVDFINTDFPKRLKRFLK
jgi:alkaline phosphatase